MIGITHEVDSEINVMEKLLQLGINFIQVKVITCHKFLLVFEDKESFNDFDSNLISNIFFRSDIHI